ncbi:MAG: MerR family transcriptional regulator [Bdellovibrionales bacterium]|nr:MerR family transcriptional regulator [Bdellovibrionales bacterium]
MSDSKAFELSQAFELPKATEKLSHKFILDSLYEEQTLKSEIISTHIVEQCGAQTELPIAIEEDIPESVPIEALSLEAGKKYFRIGEVSTLIGVEPYVLRYWESEFSVIRPTKASSGHRVYQRKDVEALHVIRHLLHVEKYSIKGAKIRFNEKKKETKESQTQTKHNLKSLSIEIKELIQLIKTY